ncbi:hypothetical protein BXZ70DRAFT_474644 [Cristinia sonorae]|uniref:Uncharacterized protein n=1 Tax=Cristinia sonorae TaxID=1940300 RepID=A0A8K0UJ92_9AGAR|nr:hypothetical protein BXZ70DRAFT_474644 [Cristinia sonorae]
MKLSFLNEVYCPAGSTDVYPEELYKKILTYQAKKDNTAQIVLPEVRVENGTFHTPIFKDPMEEMPFDIIITDLVVSSKGGPAAFGEYDRPKDDWKGPCLKGKLQIENGGCGIKTSSGKIEIRPLWKKEGAEVMELFEGSFTFDVKYSAMYSKRGHGKGQNLTLNFWAVRAQT